jgi:putative phosphoribosyl transferase
MFVDRVDAGRWLGQRLQHLRGEDVVVLGLPRGGVPVASEIAAALGAPLDIIVVRELGVPSQPEVGMGAIGEGGVRVINRDVVRLAGIADSDIAEVEDQERSELERRAHKFRRDLSPIPLTGRIAVVVDDGIATGSTARAACQVVRAMGAARVVLAVPVAPRDWVARVGTDADEVICLETPPGFTAVGQWYSDFAQTTDEEVIDCLERHREAAASGGGGAVRAGTLGEPPEGFFGDEALLVELEEAQGYESFVDPDAVVPAGALRQGAPGHEALVGDEAGLGRDVEDEARERAPEQSYDT